MSLENTTVVEGATAIATKPAKKTAPKAKPATKGKVVKGKGKPAKANTAPKSKPMSNDGRSVHADLPTREPKWNDRRRNVVLAMRNLGATTGKDAATAEMIAKAAGSLKGSPELKGEDGPRLVKIILDVYRTAELIHNGFAASTRHEGDRALRYYLTAKGKTTKFPEKKPAKADKAE